jgi:PPM family protein phosphatase
MNDIKIFALSDIGMVREKNEDSCWIGEFRGAAVLLVADGMGGAVGGKIASATAVEVISEAFRKEYGKRKEEEIITAAMARAHAAIRQKGETTGGNLNMGTTCTLAVITETQPAVDSSQLLVNSKKKREVEKKTKVIFGHIGDSKLYHIRRDLVVQQSTDHTMLQRMLDAGALKPEEAENFGHKNIIYKSLGGAEKVDLDPVQSFELEPSDALLLCSDGLSNFVKREEMANILRGTRHLKAAADYLVNLAKFRGGEDNITVVLAEYGSFARDRSLKLERVPRTSRASRPGGGKRLAVFSLLTVLLVLCAVLFIVLKSGSSSKKRMAEAAQAVPAEQLLKNTAKKEFVDSAKKDNKGPTEKKNAAKKSFEKNQS